MTMFATLGPQLPLRAGTGISGKSFHPPCCHGPMTCLGEPDLLRQRLFHTEGYANYAACREQDLRSGVEQDWSRYPDALTSAACPS